MTYDNLNMPLQIRKPVRLGGSDYYWVGTEKYPRVTTVLGCLSKPALVHWSGQIEREACFEAAEEALDRYTRAGLALGSFKAYMLEALAEKLGRSKNGNIKLASQVKKEGGADIGRQAHDYIQWYLKKQLGLEHGHEPKLHDKAINAAVTWINWAESVHLEAIRVEHQVYSDIHKSAGTLDLDSKIDYQGARRRCVWDWKSTNRSKTAPDGIYFEAKVQVATYREMLVGLGEGPEFTLAGILRLPKNIEEEPYATPFIMEPEEAMRHAAFFEDVRRTWQGIQELNP